MSQTNYDNRKNSDETFKDKSLHKATKKSLKRHEDAILRDITANDPFLIQDAWDELMDQEEEFRKRY